MCLGALALLGCGQETVARDEVVTLTRIETKTVPSSTDLGGTPPSGAVSAVPTGEAVTEGGDIRIPDVIGRDHQLAQDMMQAAGLYNLAEEDATGQSRVLLWDRNWVVVAQSPPAGSRVKADTTIVLRSKKDDE